MNAMAILGLEDRIQQPYDFFVVVEECFAIRIGQIAWRYNTCIELFRQRAEAAFMKTVGNVSLEFFNCWMELVALREGHGFEGDLGSGWSQGNPLFLPIPRRKAEQGYAEQSKSVHQHVKH